MSLVPKYTITFGCNYDEITQTQTTGIYNADTNDTGYGTPNPEVGDVTATSLEITNLLTDTIFDTITDITASNTEEDYVIDITDLTVDGAVVYDTAIEDGIFEFVFTVTAGGTDYTYTIRKLVLPTLWGMLAKASLKITGDGCKCADKFVPKWLLGFAYLTALEGTAICGDLTQFQNQYDFVYNYLSNLKCGC